MTRALTVAFRRRLASCLSHGAVLWLQYSGSSVLQGDC